MYSTKLQAKIYRYNPKNEHLKTFFVRLEANRYEDFYFKRSPAPSILFEQSFRF